MQPGVRCTAAAAAVGCSRQTASKWVNRDRRGEPLADRSSRPHRSPRRTAAAVEEAILRAREQLREGPHVIGWALGVAASTVHAVLRRHGRSRLASRPAAEEVIRYEYAHPGGLIHVDIKKLGRILKPGHRVTGDRSSQDREDLAAVTMQDPRSQRVVDMRARRDLRLELGAQLGDQLGVLLAQLRDPLVERIRLERAAGSAPTAPLPRTTRVARSASSARTRLGTVTRPARSEGWTTRCS
jgi:hypothetical protein